LTQRQRILERQTLCEGISLSEFIDETRYMQVKPGSLVNIESDSKIKSINVIDGWY
jgi:hypothetical protein